MLRQHVKDLIESGRALASAPIGSYTATCPTPLAPDWKNQDDQFRKSLADLDAALTDAFGMIHLVAERLIWETEDSSILNAGCVAAGINSLVGNVEKRLHSTKDKVWEDWKELSEALKKGGVQ